MTSAPYRKAAPRGGEVPSAPAIERALLGAVLADEETAWGENVGALVNIADFFVPQHRAVWEAMLRLRAEHTPVTTLTVTDMLSRLDYLDAVDDLTKQEGYTEPYLVGLWGDVFSAVGCAAYARIIHDHAERRALMQAGIAMIQDAQRGRAAVSIYDRAEYQGVDF